MNEKEREQIERAAKAGFTLMEVMVAVMIVGLLTALAVTNVGRYMRRANITATQQQIETISNAIITYQMDHNSKLPETLDALTEGDDPIIEKGNMKDAWGNDFQYEKLGKKRFKLTSAGPDEEFGTEDDLSNIDTDKKSN
ncbi:MAG: type II secretion system protein GspG [Kiritimatiellae bacterium]|nr:type II secretion system protein GspG [Kiritimatiellia bacterium]